MIVWDSFIDGVVAGWMKSVEGWFLSDLSHWQTIYALVARGWEGGCSSPRRGGKKMLNMRSGLDRAFGRD